VYRPFEDAALSAQIKEECQEPDLPQQQAVNEVLELLAHPPPAGATASETVPAAVESQTAPAVDLLDLEPTPSPAAANVDLLGEAIPVASADLLGDASLSVPVVTVDTSTQRVDTQPQAEPDFLDALLGAPPAASSQEVDTTQAPSTAGGDDFDALLAGQSLLGSSSASMAPASLPADGIPRPTTQEMDKVADMSQLQGLSSIRSVPSTLDLSVPAPGEDLRDQEVNGDDNQGFAVRVTEAISGVIPAKGCGAIIEGRGATDGAVKTEGFGSEDVFGPEKKTRSITEEAQEAWSKFVSVLPDQVRQHIEAEPVVGPTHSNASASNAPAPSGVSLAPEPASSSRSDAAGLGLIPDATPLESAHKDVTISRAGEGKWVPTYMRHQLAQGGHTSMPTSVNAHEYPADRPPPSVQTAFQEMGQEVQENAQAVLTYMIAFISSLALQCQMCSQNAATNLHESSVDFCSQARRADSGEEEKILGRWVDEADMGLGPVRSSVQRTIQGVGLDSILDIARSKLVMPRLPPGSQPTSSAPIAFQRLVKVREIIMQSTGVSDSFVVNSEADVAALPQEVLPHLGGLSQLCFQERWRVDRKEGKAFVEFSNEHLMAAEVIVAIRMDIQELPAITGAVDIHCKVDSRLYAKPRSHGAVMPLGLVEKLTQMHNYSAHILQEVVLSLAEDTS
jgi:hypothetical protein